MTILITGGSKGIGQEIARTAAARGARTLIAYGGDHAAAASTVRELEVLTPGAAAFQADLATERGVRELFERVAERVDTIDALVNSAGVFETAPLEEVTDDTFAYHFALNVFGLTHAIKEAMARFSPRGGSVVNIGSSVSSFTPAGSVVYNASKGAVDAITRTLANELGPRGIRVNSINPGLTATPGMQRSEFSADAFVRDIEARTPLGRIGVPADLAGAACFLISEESSWLTGETIVIGGGLH
ncbi:SDR family oxidoreductase [Agrococcus versicolor]